MSTCDGLWFDCCITHIKWAIHIFHTNIFTVEKTKLKPNGNQWYQSKAKNHTKQPMILQK